MTIDLETLQSNFGRWLQVYAFKKDPAEPADFIVKLDQGIWTIRKWTHSTPKPNIATLLAELSPEDLTSYESLMQVNDFLVQADPSLKAGYLLLWKRLRLAEGDDLSNEEVLEDLRQSIVAELNSG